jgi:putative nucleotidyltransferase with HDIG domain
MPTLPKWTSKNIHVPPHMGSATPTTEEFLTAIKRDLEHDDLVLPSLPEVVFKVRQVLEDPDSSLADLAQTIGTDPALSTKVLRVANSAYYRGAHPVHELTEAVVRMGDDTIEHLVVFLVVAELYNSVSDPRIRAYGHRLWSHSTLVAAISRVIARRLPHLSPEQAMVAGLLHDMGVLPLLTKAEAYPGILETPDALARAVHLLHGEVGRRILERWNFPQELVDVVAEHDHLSRNTSGEPDYTDVVMVANVMSRADSDHWLAAVSLDRLAAYRKLGLTAEDTAHILAQAEDEVSELRTVATD